MVEGGVRYDRASRRARMHAFVHACELVGAPCVYLCVFACAYMHAVTYAHVHAPNSTHAPDHNIRACALARNKSVSMFTGMREPCRFVPMEAR